MLRDRDGKRRPRGGFPSLRVAPVSYQTRQAAARIMGEPALQPKAWANSGMLETTPFTRYLGSAWGSVFTLSVASASVMLEHQTWAWPRKKRWAGVNPSIGSTFVSFIVSISAM